jgi:hypothetical protein
MKKVTITYTRQSSDTPWFWQTTSGEALNSPVNNFIFENREQITQSAYINTPGDKNIVILNFATDEIYQQFKTFVDSETASGIVEYCQANNITIERLEEDI